MLKSTSRRGAEVTPNNTIQLTFALKNSGSRDGDEVAQVYFRHVRPAVPQAQLTLCGFQRVTLKSGQLTKVALQIPAQRLRYWDTSNRQ